MYSLLRLVPKNHLSALVGYISRQKQFQSFQKILISWFVKRYGVCIEEMEKPLAEYDCLGTLFTRKLRNGVRPISGDIVCPVDGRLTESGAIESDTLIQAKGKSYSLAKLLGSEEIAKTYYQGRYYVFYLAPGDYHRIHSPVAGEIKKIIHIPGALWPVNEWSIRSIDGLFAKNERLISLVSSSSGEVAVVKVGATNVGQITSPFSDIRTNQLAGSQTQNVAILDPKAIVEAGDHLGTFEMGSTVVLLFERDMIPASARDLFGVCRYGSPFFT
jgi:phosphatidylserine decarboxylase